VSREVKDMHFLTSIFSFVNILPSSATTPNRVGGLSLLSLVNDAFRRSEALRERLPSGDLLSSPITLPLPGSQPSLQEFDWRDCYSAGLPASEEFPFDSPFF